MKKHIWHHVVTKKVLNKSKYILDFRFFKVATLCLDDSFHTLGILSTSFMRNAYPTVLKEFPHMLSTCWLLFLHSAVQLIPKLGDWAIVEARSFDVPLHHSPWSNSPYTAWCVLDHCPVEKQMIVPLSTNQMGWHTAAECCGSHAG